jgi:hypothetical protein
MKGFKMKTVSIGYFRDDGDFALLATLNNNDGDIKHFNFLIADIKAMISDCSNIECIALEREDAPDYVTIN